MAQQNDRLDDESYKTLLKAHLRMGCLDEAEELTEGICTKGILANRVTFNELLHATRFRVRGCQRPPMAHEPFRCVGTPRPRQSGSQQLVPLTLSKRMTEITISFGTTLVCLLVTNGGENCPFVGKREARNAEFPSWAEGWLHSWLLRKAQLCGSLAENQRS